MELEEFINTFDINKMDRMSQFLDVVCNATMQEDDKDQFKSLVFDIINKTSGKNEFKTGLNEVLRELADQHKQIFMMYQSVFSMKASLTNDVPNWEDYVIGYYFKIIDDLYSKMIDEFKKIDRDVLPSNVVSHIRDST